MRLTKHHGLGNDFLVLLDLDGTQPGGAGGRRRALRPPHRASAPTGCSAATAGTGGRRRDDGAAQRRRLGGRDERQRHPLPGPGRVPGRARARRPCSAWPPTAGLRTVRVRRPSAGPATQRMSVEMGAGQGRRPRAGVGRRRRARAPPASTSATPTWCCSGVGAELPGTDELVGLGAQIDGADPGRGQRRGDPAGRPRRTGSTWSSTSGASAPPRPAAPAPAPWPRRPTSGACASATRDRPHARRAGRGHPRRPGAAHRRRDVRRRHRHAVAVRGRVPACR